jgi:hypothetical protein
MAEHKVQVPFMGKLVEGMDVPISESSEKWSEITLEDGTIIRVKQSVASVIRIDGQFDLEGNPMYVVKSAPSVAIVHVNPERRRKVN